MFTLETVSHTKARSAAKILGVIAALPCCWATAMIVQSIMQRQPLAHGVALIGGISTTLVVMAIAGLVLLQPVRPRPLPQTAETLPTTKQAAPHTNEQLT